MKDLLAVATLVADECGSATQFALALAHASDAHLTALVAEIEPGVPSPPVEPDNMQGSIESGKALSARERLTKMASLVQGAATAKGVQCTILLEESSSSPLREVLIRNAQVRDLVTLDVYGPLRDPRLNLIQAVLFNTGRPIVLVPPAAGTSVDGKILIAWDATRSAVRAVHDALLLLIRAREVIVVSVTDDKEIHEPYSGNDLCRYLNRWKINAHFEIAKRGSTTIGAALLDYAHRIKADLLVMGGYGHAFERQLMFGSATRDIFQSTLRLPIFLSH